MNEPMKFDNECDLININTIKINLGINNYELRDRIYLGNMKNKCLLNCFNSENTPTKHGHGKITCFSALFVL